jgi:hypothetical protein
MGRNRASAKKAGTSFETLIAHYLATHVDERIERRAHNGPKDRGDISGLSHLGHRIVVECKNTTVTDLPGWSREAQIEAGNDDALLGVVCHKRRGNARPEDQWVTMTLADLVALLMGERPDSEDED